MSTHDYTSTLVAIGIITGVHIFCFLIIYQFRKNLVDERNIRRGSRSSTATNDGGNTTQQVGFEPSAPYGPGKYL